MVGSKKTLPTLQEMVLSLNVTNKTVMDNYLHIGLKGRKGFASQINSQFSIFNSQFSIFNFQLSILND